MERANVFYKELLPFLCEVYIVVTITFSFWKVQMVSLQDRSTASHVAVCLSGCGGRAWGLESTQCQSADPICAAKYKPPPKIRHTCTELISVLYV